MPSQIWDWHSFHKEISTDLPNVGCAGMDCSSILISCSQSCSATCFDLSIIAILAFVWSCCCFIAMDKVSMSISHPPIDDLDKYSTELSNFIGLASLFVNKNTHCNISRFLFFIILV